MKIGKFFPKISYSFFKEHLKKLDRAFWLKVILVIIAVLALILISALVSLNRLRRSFVTDQKKIEQIETKIKAGEIKTVRVNKIPERFVQIPSRVSDMEINDTCWINYICIDSSHNIWIDPREWIYPLEGRVKIIKSDSGFIVDLSYCSDYQWLMYSSLDKLGYYPAHYIIIGEE